jgi:hypothetical protein
MSLLLTVFHLCHMGFHLYVIHTLSICWLLARDQEDLTIVNSSYSSQASKAQNLSAAAIANGDNEAVKGAYHLDKFVSTSHCDDPYYFPGERAMKRAQSLLPELDGHLTKLAGAKTPKL